MKNKVEYLFDCLSEELGEATQVVGKIQRFGLQDSSPSDVNHIPNDLKLGRELNDVLAVVQLLAENGIVIPAIFDAKHIEEKKNKVRSFYSYSIERGCLEPENNK